MRSATFNIFRQWAGKLEVTYDNIVIVRVRFGPIGIKDIANKTAQLKGLSDLYGM